jgi:hypothetical protein
MVASFMSNHQDRLRETNGELDNPGERANKHEAAGSGEAAAGKGPVDSEQRDNSSASAHRRAPSGGDVHALLSRRIVGLNHKPQNRWQRFLRLILGR